MRGKHVLSMCNANYQLHKINMADVRLENVTQLNCENDDILALELAEDNTSVGESVYSSDSDAESVISSSSQRQRGKDIRKQKGKPGKRGRKAKWTHDCTNDLVDIICKNEV